MSFFLVEIEFTSIDKNWGTNYLTEPNSRLTALLKDDLKNVFWENYSNVLIHFHQSQKLLYRVKSVQSQSVYLTQVWKDAQTFQEYSELALQGQSLARLLEKQGIFARTVMQEVSTEEAVKRLNDLQTFPHILQFVAKDFFKPEMCIGDPLKKGSNYLPFPWIPISEKLKSRPHVPLPVSVPLDSIKREIQNKIDGFSHIQLNLGARNENGKERAWFGRGLIDYRKDSRDLYEYLALKKEWIKFDKNGDVQVYETELAAHMPETLNFVYSLVSEPRVTRILWIPPGAILPWHSHCQSLVVGPQPYRKMVVQIPIQTNPCVNYRVRELDSDENSSVDKNYLAGEAWIFNSWHLHQVENNGKEPRIALYVEASLTDQLFLSHVERALLK